MPAANTRVGAPANPVITTEGLPGTSDQVRTFRDDNGAPAYARPCVITNMHATEDLYVAGANEEGASPTNFMVKLAAGQAVDVSMDGRVNVSSVSFYFATADYEDFVQVRGWLP